MDSKIVLILKDASDKYGIIKHIQYQMTMGFDK